ncbi:PREDICTED: facilitated trehalose transporter Tret1-like [Vollenhovia emeryi]|uniref:facilitated trehalose transporter Tret1-like n=1 Tax=Vollenhovia emeryi TaxID=411798 RepID=UPI0005F40249|nr:PREDICTED: facilitated trehalose transporter Tret1-like [Vollenhovia emeryi]XP_011873757.1 PREDICTED: facilitated trehalose transporter Tret1-like [Vollenhovia emeryi]
MEQSRVKRWPQYLAAITATLSLAATGSHIGWTSPTLPTLKSPDSHVPITSDDASWIASFYLLGTIPGCIVAAFIVDRLGRKTSLLVGGVPLTISYILIITAWNPYVLYAARGLGGIGQGIVYVICPMYIGEIADKEIRGTLGSFIKLMVTFGELYAHAIGPFVSYHLLGYTCLLIPLVFFMSFPWMPESPYYLLMKNRQENALSSIKRLKRCVSKEQLETDIEQMQKIVVRDLSDRGRFWDLFGTPGNRRAVIVSIGLQLILQFSGICAIESYTQEILEEGDAGLPASNSVILLSMLQLIAGLGAVVLVDKLGRRPLLITTTLLAGIALTIAGLFYLVKFQFGVDTTGYGWLLHSSVIFYELIIALGLNPLPYMMLGELFPTNVKGAAVSLANTIGSLLAFIVSKMYQVMSDNWGVYTAFAWFAISCYLGVVFIVLMVPETKGKSLLEIQEELNCKNNEKKKESCAKGEKQMQDRYRISTIA